MILREGPPLGGLEGKELEEVAVGHMQVVDGEQGRRSRASSDRSTRWGGRGGLDGPLKRSTGGLEGAEDLVGETEQELSIKPPSRTRTSVRDA